MPVKDHYPFWVAHLNRPILHRMFFICDVPPLKFSRNIPKLGRRQLPPLPQCELWLCHTTIVMLLFLHRTVLGWIEVCQLDGLQQRHIWNGIMSVVFS